MFSRRIIEEVLGSWKWGVPDKDKKRIKDHLVTLQILKERGVKGSGIIGAYHTRRVVRWSWIFFLTLFRTPHILHDSKTSSMRRSMNAGKGAAVSFLT